jgi:hypothetical protein
MHMFYAVKLISYIEKHFHFEYQNVILFYALLFSIIFFIAQSYSYHF